MRYCLSIRLVVLFTCMLALGACTGRNALRGTAWRLERFTVGESSLQLVPTAPVTLQFSHGSATYLGSSGCNYYSGTYTNSENQLRLHFRDVTARACAGPIMSQEVTYLNAMGKVRAYQVNGRTLTLRDNHSSVILIFIAT